MTIEVDKEIKLTQLEPLDAKDIFATIDSQRDYLGKWLTYVCFSALSTRKRESIMT